MQAAVTMMCPHCRGALKINASPDTKVFQCPRCRGTFASPRVGRPAQKAANRNHPAQRSLPYKAPPTDRKRAIVAAAAIAVILLAVGVAVGASLFGGRGAVTEQHQVPIVAIPVPPVVASTPEPQPASVPAVKEPANEPAPPKPAVAAQPPAPSAPVPEPPPVKEEIARNDTRPAPAVQVERNQNAAQARAEPPAPKLNAEEKRVQDAILRGTRFLQQGRNQNQGHAVGYAAFPGLALLECGVPAKERSVQELAAFVRTNSRDLRATYELALAVLFLDRLGDARDEALIQTLALRLVGGQNANGGWSYHCPLLTPPEELELITFLKKNRPTPIPTPIRPEDFPNLVPLNRPGELRVTTPLPVKQETQLPMPLLKWMNENFPQALEGNGESIRIDPVRVEPSEPAPVVAKTTLEPAPAAPMPTPPKVAPKKVVEPAPELPVSFPAKKGKNGAGGKGKDRDNVDGDDRPEFLKKALPVMQDRFAMKKGHRDDNSNTHFAILALWAARRHDVPMMLPLSMLDKRFRSSQYEDGRWGYRFNGPGGARASMTAVGLLGLGIGHGNFRDMWAGGVAMEERGIKLPPRQDPAIQRGLAALAQYIDTDQKRSVQDLYFMWTVERVAVLYNLQTIGQKDWYRWGTDQLLAEQSADGSWHTQSFSGSSSTIDTCMALLFLRKANLLDDLTRNIQPFVAANDPR